MSSLLGFEIAVFTIYIFFPIFFFLNEDHITPAIEQIIPMKNARTWASMVSYLKI